MRDYDRDYNAYDYCWETGNYDDQICEFCPHKSECSGHEGDEDFD